MVSPTKSSHSPERQVVRYLCASSIRPPMTMGISSSCHTEIIGFIGFFPLSHSITSVSTPYITKCVHLSTREISLSGVSGIGIKHNTHIATVTAMLKGKVFIISVIISAAPTGRVLRMPLSPRALPWAIGCWSFRPSYFLPLNVWLLVLQTVLLLTSECLAVGPSVRLTSYLLYHYTLAGRMPEASDKGSQPYSRAVAKSFVGALLCSVAKRFVGFADPLTPHL